MKNYTLEEEYDIIEKAQAGCIKSRNLLIENNVRLVTSIVNKYKNKGVEFEDLFQEGVIGIIKAIDAFSFEHTCRFSTHAYMHIQRNVQTAISNNASTIKKPDAKYVLMMRINRIKPLLRNELGRDATIDEITEALETQHKEYKNRLTSDDINEAIEIFQPIASINFKLDSSSDSDDGAEMEEVLICEDENEKADIFLKYEAVDFWESVDAILASLSRYERDVIKYTYGIGVKALTTKEIVKQCGIVSEKKVKEFEQSALLKIKKSKILARYYNEIIENYKR